MPVEAAAREIEALHHSAKGSTFSLFFGSQADQPLFVYSPFPELAAVISEDLTRAHLMEYIIGRLEVLKLDPRMAIGTWLDTEDGRTYIDIVVIVPEKELAVSEGRKYNQIGVFDLRRKKLIRTGGTGIPLPQFVPFEQRLPPLVRSPEKENDERL